MCWSQTRANKLATPLGKKEDQSSAMAGKLPKPSEVDAANIQRPKVEETSAEEQKTLAEIRKKIREQKEREIRELEEEAMKQYVSHFSVDRQGNVKKNKDIIIDIPLLKVQSDASPEVNSDLANLVDTSVAAHMNNKFDAMNENFTKLVGQIDAKVNLLISGKDPYGSTSHAENNNDSDIFDNLHILKFLLLHHQ